MISKTNQKKVQNRGQILQPDFQETLMQKVITKSEPKVAENLANRVYMVVLTITQSLRITLHQTRQQYQLYQLKARQQPTQTFL